MVENEYRALIDRDTSIKQVKDHFSGPIKVLQDIVNYGSNLLPRCWVSSKRQLEDTIILGVLLRQAIVMLDAIEILLSNAAIHSCYLQVRSIFEVSLYLDFILQADTKKRADYYYVSNVRREKVWAMRTQVGSNENISYIQVMGQFAGIIEKKINELSSKERVRIDEIDRILNQKNFFAINDDFEKYRKARNHNPHWHAPLGPKNVRQLAETLNRLPEYEVIYRLSSELAHTASLKNHIKFADKKVEFTPIRYLEGIDEIVTYSVGYLVKIYMAVLNHYRPGELANFRKKYVNDWRKDFLGIKPVPYTDDPNCKTII